MLDILFWAGQVSGPASFRQRNIGGLIKKAALTKGLQKKFNKLLENIFLCLQVCCCSELWNKIVGFGGSRQDGSGYRIENNYTLTNEENLILI